MATRILYPTPAVVAIAPTSITHDTQKATKTVSTKPVDGIESESLFYLHCNGDANNNDDSVVSDITNLDLDDDLHSTIEESEWELTQALHNETDNIRRVLEMDEDEDKCIDISMTMGMMVDEDEEIELVAVAADQAEILARQMAEATAWMNDPALLDDSQEENDDHEETFEEIIEEIIEEEEQEDEEPKSEWCAYWSETYNREYYHNSVTDETSWSKPHEFVIDSTGIEEVETDEVDDSSTTSTATPTVTMTPVETELSTTQEEIATNDMIKEHDITKSLTVMVTEECTCTISDLNSVLDGGLTIKQDTQHCPDVSVTTYDSSDSDNDESESLQDSQTGCGMSERGIDGCIFEHWANSIKRIAMAITGKSTHGSGNKNAFIVPDNYVYVNQ